MSTKAKKLSQTVEEHEFKSFSTPEGNGHYILFSDVIAFQSLLVKQIRKLELSVTVAQAEAKYYKDLAVSAKVGK